MLGVHVNYRSLGLGKTIVDYCVEMAKHKGCYKVKLCCKDSLVNFYEKLGFGSVAKAMEIELKNG